MSKNSPAISKCETEKNNQNTLDIGKPKVYKVRICVFFDGTGNNKTNTEARDIAMEKMNINNPSKINFSNKLLLKLEVKNDLISDTEDKKITAFVNQSGSDSSYYNDKSNVAKLFDSVLEFNTDESMKIKNGYHFIYNIYISGIGTQDLGSDELTAQGLGQSWIANSGVDDNVKKSVGEILNKINYLPNYKKGVDQLELTIDCVGFSRGAAASRYFSYLALKDEKEKIEIKNNQLSKQHKFSSPPKLRFVGLFDSVLSVIGLTGRQTSEKWFQNEGIETASQVIHLVAGDEFRKNFPLTKTKVGITKILPGAHSDVGGGYYDYMDENDRKIYDIHGLKKDEALDKAYNFLVNKGWYLPPSELTKNNFFYTITVNRKQIRNTYSLVPLNIMKNYMEKEQFIFNSLFDAEMTKLKNDSELMKLKSIIGDLAENTNDTISKTYYNKYFHFSSECGIVNGPNLIDNAYEREKI